MVLHWSLLERLMTIFTYNQHQWHFWWNISTILWIFFRGNAFCNWFFSTKCVFLVKIRHFCRIKKLFCFKKPLINTLHSLIHIYIHLNSGSKSKFSYLTIDVKIYHLCMYKDFIITTLNLKCKWNTLHEMHNDIIAARVPRTFTWHLVKLSSLVTSSKWKRRNPNLILEAFLLGLFENKSEIKKICLIIFYVVMQLTT
jgi:hypothetical protein